MTVPQHQATRLLRLGVDGCQPNARYANDVLPVASDRASLSHPLNPLLLILVVAPQLAYLAALRWVAERPSSRVARVHDKLTYYSGGYVTILEKNS